MSAPPAAAEFYREQRRLAAKTLRPAALMWGEQAPDDFDAWFAEHGAELAALLVAGQNEAVSQALDYTAAVLAEQGITTRPDVDPDPTGLVGVAGDGRPIESLLYGSVITARRAIARAPEVNPATIRDGWAESGILALGVRMKTVLADTSRVATSLAVIARPRVGYTRLLVGSSCSRCAVLAGRTYGSASAFLRHPACDCRHVPGPSNRLASVDPDEYFRSLDRAEQDAKFTAAGAQAIRDGADVAQVVNARRGAAGLDYASGRITAAEAAAIRGNKLARAGLTTTESTTRRGLAYRALRAEGTPPPKRLMPEAIYQAAGEDRDAAMRLLQRHGYLRPDVTPPRVAGGTGGGPPRTPPRPPTASGAPDFDPARTPAARRAATQVRTAAEAAEPAISAEVRAAAIAVGGRLDRFESRLKEPDSLARKIDLELAKGVDAGAAKASIRDAVRYTMVVDDVDYWQRGDDVVTSMAAAGIGVRKQPAGWSATGYKGRNLTFVGPDGVEFEVQIHTEASLSAAERSHDLYDIARDTAVPAAQRAQAQRQIDRIYADVPIPAGTPLIS